MSGIVARNIEQQSKIIKRREMNGIQIAKLFYSKRRLHAIYLKNLTIVV